MINLRSHSWLEPKLTSEHRPSDYEVYSMISNSPLFGKLPVKISSNTLKAYKVCLTLPTSSVRLWKGTDRSYLPHALQSFNASFPSPRTDLHKGARCNAQSSHPFCMTLRGTETKGMHNRTKIFKSGRCREENELRERVRDRQKEKIKGAENTCNLLCLQNVIYCSLYLSLNTVQHGVVEKDQKKWNYLTL